MKKRTIAAIAVAGFIGIGAVSNAVGVEEKESTTAATPSKSAPRSEKKNEKSTDPLHPDNNKGQTPSEVASGFCKSVAGKFKYVNEANSKAITVAQAAAEFPGLYAEDAVKAFDKVGVQAWIAGEDIKGVNRLPALDSDLDEKADALATVLVAAPSVDYLTQVPAFSAWMKRASKSVDAFTEACL